MLLDEALEGLKARVCHGADNGAPHGRDEGNAAPPPQEVPKPIWEQICDAFANVPDDELATLPEDGAAQVDHYVYGLPSTWRPAWNSSHLRGPFV